MTNYKDLSEWQQQKVIKDIIKCVEPEPKENKHNGFKWVEPDYTINEVKSGNYCATCWNIYYNCLCSHD